MTGPVQGRQLRSGHTTNCGCVRRAKVRAIGKRSTHGQHGTRTYRIWRAMRNRCSNPKAKSWLRYGGRGITVCARWESSFANFFADMGTCPDGLTIERKDNDLGYEPDNCRWATWAEQRANRG